MRIAKMHIYQASFIIIHEPLSYEHHIQIHSCLSCKLGLYKKYHSKFQIFQEMYQFYNLAVLGQDNAFTSGYVASKEIKNFLWVRRGALAFSHEWHT